jgi:hypothetical protein
MAITKLKITAQVQVAVTANKGDAVVRCVVEHSFAAVHQALFGASPPVKAALNIKDGIKKQMQLKHGRQLKLGKCQFLFAYVEW